MTRKTRAPVPSKYIKWGEPVATFFNRSASTLHLFNKGCWIVDTKADANALERQLNAVASRLGLRVKVASSYMVFSETAYTCVAAEIIKK